MAAINYSNWYSDYASDIEIDSDTTLKMLVDTI